MAIGGAHAGIWSEFILTSLQQWLLRVSAGARTQVGAGGYCCLDATGLRGMHSPLHDPYPLTVVQAAALRCLRGMQQDAADTAGQRTSDC